jgi:hypothetical protein
MNLATHYAGDVNHLALARIFEVKSPYRDSVVIPQIVQDTIWEALSAIYNAAAIPERDSVFDVYCIHHDISNYLFRDISVKIDQHCPWFNNWQQLKIQTGVSGLDSLFSMYGFELDYFAMTHWAFLQTSQSLNLNALCNLLRGYAYVIDAQPSGYLGDGDEINYRKIGSDRYLDFKLGFGDCPAGCTGNHTYKFHVQDDCSVTFLGTVDQTIPGLPLPWPTNCRITGSRESEDIQPVVRVYPNPATACFYLETGSMKVVRYEIRNGCGLLVDGGPIRSDLSVGVASLPQGVYYVCVFDEINRPFQPVKLIKLAETVSAGR